MRRSVLIPLMAFVLLASQPSAFAATPALWVATQGRYGTNHGNAVALSPDGTVTYMTGELHTSKGQDLVLNAYNVADGTLLWGHRYQGASSTAAAGLHLVVSPDGTRIYVTGTSDGTSEDILTIAYSSTGDRLWVRRLDVSNDTDQPVGIEVAPDGGTIYVGGTMRAAGSNENFGVVAYDASGRQRWFRMYDQNTHDEAAAMAIDPNGNRVYLTGLTQSPGNQDYLTVAWRTRWGKLVWHRNHTSANYPTWDDATAIATSPDSKTVVVTGQSDGGNGSNAVTIAYASVAGTQKWSGHWGEGVADGRAVAFSPDGSRVYVTGSQYVYSYDLVTVAYRANGTELWERVLDNRGGDDRGEAIATSQGGAVFVTGYSNYSAGTLIRYTSAGGVTAMYPAGNDLKALAVLGDGVAVVTGTGRGIVTAGVAT